MGDFLFLIEDLAIGLYIIGGVTVVWNFMQFARARSLLQTAQFTLEREFAERRGGHAFTRMLFAIQLLIAIWGVSTVGAEEWRAGLPEEEPEIEIEAFVTSTPAAGEPVDLGAVATEEGFTLPQTAPPPSTPAGTIIPSQERRNCVRDRAWIEYPENGMVIFEAVPIRGTASIEDFAYYRFEIKTTLAGENFAPIVEMGDYYQPVTNPTGELGQFTPYNFLPGEYRLRIVVFNTANEPKANCEISIHIMEPIAEPTAQFGSGGTN